MTPIDPRKPKSPFIQHPQLQDGFGYFICEQKGCKHQIIPMIDGYVKTINLPHVQFPNRTVTTKIKVTMCRGCKREYTLQELEKLTKKKKVFRAVKITM